MGYIMHVSGISIQRYHGPFNGNYGAIIGITQIKINLHSASTCHKFNCLNLGSSEE